MDTPYGRMIAGVMTPITLSDGRTLLKALTDHQRYIEGIIAGVRLSLTSEDLSLIDFTGFNLDKATFDTCDLTRSIINDDTCFGVLWKTCNLTSTLFSVDQLPRNRFNTCNLTRTIFVGVNLFSVAIFNSDMTETAFGFTDTDALTIKVTAGASDAQKGLLADWTATANPGYSVVSGVPGDMV